MWKLAPAAVVTLVACSLAFFAGCSKSKGVKGEAAAKPDKPAKTSTKHPFDNALISKGQDDVRKRFGDPTVVSKTIDDHLLWVYVPTWRILPNDKGYLYVEFENGKVIKIFRKP
jgi:hypothetical protein